MSLCKGDETMRYEVYIDGRRFEERERSLSQPEIRAYCSAFGCRLEKIDYNEFPFKYIFTRIKETKDQEGKK